MGPGPVFHKVSRSSGLMESSNNEEDSDTRPHEQLSEIDEREVRRLVLTRGGIPARDWLAKERGYSTAKAKATVDPFLDEPVATDVPAWDFFFALGWFLVGVSIAFTAYLLFGTTGFLFYVPVVVAGLFCLRGLWKAGRYFIAVRG